MNGDTSMTNWCPRWFYDSLPIQDENIYYVYR